MEANRDSERKTVRWFVCSRCSDQFPPQQSQYLLILFISSFLKATSYSKYVEELEYRSCHLHLLTLILIRVGCYRVYLLVLSLFLKSRSHPMHLVPNKQIPQVRGLHLPQFLERDSQTCVLELGKFKSLFSSCLFSLLIFAHIPFSFYSLVKDLTWIFCSMLAAYGVPGVDSPTPNSLPPFSSSTSPLFCVFWQPDI